MKCLQNGKIDEKDWEIIVALQADGRMSLVELGRRAKLKHPSVRARLNKLINMGLVKVQANINVKRLGYNVAIINVEIEDLSSAANEVKKLISCPKVFLALVKGSDYNLLLAMLYRSVGELESFIEKRVRKIPGLRRLDVELDVMLKPTFIPCELRPLNEFCEEECETCRYKEEPFSCPGCLSTGGTR